MGKWSFDEARFVEEVLKSVRDGWPPSENLFRMLLLATGESDRATISAALEGLRRELPRFVRMWSAAVDRVRAELPNAERVLRDPDLRQRHLREIRQRQERLQTSLSDRLAGAPGMPPAMVGRIVVESRGKHSASDVRRGLAELEAAQLEPIDLGVPAEPGQWRQLRQHLVGAGASSLWDYLAGPGFAGAETTTQAVDARMKQLLSRTGAQVTAERSLVTALRRIASSPGLREALLFEALSDIAGTASFYRYGEVERQVRELRPRLSALGVTSGDRDVAYAIWCERRFGDGGGSGWRSEYRRLIEAKRIRQAVDVLSAATSHTAEDLKELERLRATLAAVDADLDTAHALLGSDVEAAAQVLLQLRDGVVDDRVDAALRRCTPRPPERLQARLEGSTVVVTWQVPPAAGLLTAVVIRAEGNAPTDVGDGAELISDLHGTRFVDTSPPGGVLLHYGVAIARENEAVSAVRSCGPVVILPDVLDLRTEPHGDAISARWELPAAAIGAQVQRKGPDGAMGPVRDVGSTRFTDSGVRPRTTYTYTVAARYRLPDGAVRTSPGVVVEARTQQTPAAARNLRMSVEGEHLHFTWDSPADGRVQLWLVTRDRDAGGGQVLPSASLAGLGRPLDGQVSSTSRGATVRGGPRQGLVAAVTVLGDLAVIGPTVVVDRRLEPVRSLTAVRSSNEVRLSWVWPDGGGTARVLVTRDAPASSPRQDADLVQTITPAQYQAYGVRVPVEPGQHFFSVCLCAYVDGSEQFGPLVWVEEISLREIHYQIRRVRFSRSELTLEVDGGGGDVPMLVLRAKSVSRPMHDQDGDLVAELDGGGPTARQRFPVPTGMTRPIHLRLFSRDPAVVARPEDPGALVIR